jgi:hypothetical protein
MWCVERWREGRGVRVREGIFGGGIGMIGR